VSRTVKLPVLPDTLLAICCTAGCGGNTDSQAGTAILQGRNDSAVVGFGMQAAEGFAPPLHDTGVADDKEGRMQQLLSY
jgi:hypothetical protein